MDRPRTRRTWKRATFAALLVGFLVSSALGLGVIDRDEVMLDFSGRGGLSVQSGHSGDGSRLDDLDLVVEDTQGLVDSLELIKRYGTVGADVEHDLVSASFSASATDPGSTHLRFGDVVEVTLDDALRQVPEVDEEAMLDKVKENVSNIEVPDVGVPDLFPEPEPEPDPEPEPEYDLYTFPPDSDEPYLTLIIWADEGRAQLIVAPVQGQGGLNAVVEPGVSVQYTTDGKILDLKVDNPVRAAELGPASATTPQIRLQCATADRCEPVKKHASDLCTGPVCKNYRVAGGHTLDHSGSAGAGPETLLHLWSNDAIDGHAYVALGDGTPLMLPYTWWTGDPFSSAGVSLLDTEGDEAVTLKIQRPTADEHRLGFSLEGEAVSTLAPEGIGHQEDIDLVEVHVFLGPYDAVPTTLRTLDLAAGLIITLYKESDGTIRGVHVSDLLSGEAIVRLAEDTSGAIIAAFAPLDTTVTYAESEIQAVNDALASDLGTLSAAGEALAFQILDEATGTPDAVLTLTRDTLGCDLTPAGCLGIVLGPVEDVTGTSPPVPPTGFLLGDAPVPGADTIQVYANALAGWAVGLVPAAEETLCLLDPTDPTGDDFECTTLTTADGDAIHAAALGFLGEAGADVLAYADEEDPELLRLHVGDGEVARVSGGGIRAAGLAAAWGSGPVLEITGPDGASYTFEPTADAPDDLLDGAADGILALLPDGHQYLEQGASYQYDAYGDLQTITVYDPQDRDRHLFRYHDDGETTTLSTLLDGVAGARTVPSTMVTVAGNPATASRTTIDLHQATPKSGEGLFSEVTILREGYAMGQETAASTPAGTSLAVVFRLIEGPSSDLRISSPGVAYTDAAGELDGTRWTSGLKDNTYRVTTSRAADAPARLDAVVGFGQAPEYGARDTHRFPVPVTGLDQASDSWLYEGRLTSTAMAAASDGATVHAALAWTERHGAVALVAWDDADGAYYRHKLDASAPAATLTAPSETDTPTFEVSWGGDDDTGSGLAGYDVQYALGTTSSAGGWHTWVGGMSPATRTTQTFQGEAGETYRLRVHACDMVANCGPWSTIRTVAVAAPAAPDEDDDPSEDGTAPSLSVRSPEEGATLVGVTRLAWSVADADGGDPVVNVAYRPDGGTWQKVYSGPASGASWDTSSLVDGAYTLRFMASDGAHETTVTRSVSLANGVPEASIDDLRAASRTGAAGGPSDGSGIDVIHGDTPDDGHEDDDKDSPMVGLVPLVLGLLGLAFVARRRRP